MKTFFITGTQRSGTTLLSVLLGNHPQVDLDGKAKAFRLISSLNNYEKILPLNLQFDEDEVLKWKIENDYKGRLAEFLDFEKIGEFPNFRSLIHHSIEQRLNENGKKIWGDKSPNLQYYLADISLLFPETKIIHIIRDGRATALSHSKRAHTHILLAAQEWVDGNIVALVNQKKVGKERYHILRYEDLLNEPAKISKQLCDFLELPFDEKMLDLNQGVEKDSYVKNYFDTSKINHFKNDIPARTLKKIERIQAPLLSKMGYELVFPETKVNARPLPLSHWMWHRLTDDIKMLFRSKRIGMVDRKNVEVPISFRNRLSKFLLNRAHDFLPKYVYLKIYQKVYNKEQHFTNTKK